jgi:4-amino-4-deoxy-L-arabinose transferase-like glycosyltransferase
VTPEPRTHVSPLSIVSRQLPRTTDTRQQSTDDPQQAAGYSILHPPFSILLILLLALLVRLLLWSQPAHQLANDEIEYVTVARDLLAGRGWQFYEHYRWLRAPLYPLFLAASLWLAGGDLHRAALPNIVLSVANVYLNYRLTLALIGRRAARVAALLAAILWTQAIFASLYMSETLFTFLFTGALVCLVRPPATVQARYIVSRRLRAEQDSAVISPSYHLVGIIAAGVLFGLATLTRSITLLFLPVVALWCFFRRPTTSRSSLTTQFFILYPSLFVLCAVLTIAPWTIRNERAYGRPILVETGLSFNLWFFYEPRESHDEIYRALENIPNPAERSDYATAKGLARLREEPAILLRNLWPNWVTLLSADTTEDRFLMQSYYADVGLPLFAAALIFEDVLYPLLLIAAVLGLALHRSRTGPWRRRFGFGDPKWLVVIWVLYVVATVLLTHGETRYRHFLFPVLIPYAAWVLTLRRAKRTRSGGSVNVSLSADRPVSRTPRLLVVAVLWAVMLGVVIGAYPWEWAEQNIVRGWHTAVGDIAWAAGDGTEALRAYKRATEAHETPDGWLRRGDAARALGDPRDALHAYGEAAHLAPPYIAASTRLGDLLREIGDEPGARDAFKGNYADQQQVVDWAWNNLRPAPKDHLDIGDGLDYGYVGGVHPAEELRGVTARWTDGYGVVRLAGALNDRVEGRQVLVRLRLAAPRPNGGNVRAQVCAESHCWGLNVGPAWRTYVLPFSVARDQGARSNGAPLNVEVRSDTFDAPEGRRLGVLIDTASIDFAHPATAAQALNYEQIVIRTP